MKIEGAKYSAISFSVVTRNGLNGVEQTFKYLINFNGIEVEISEEDAVRLGDDLLQKVSDVHDPESKINKYWKDHWDPRTGELSI